MDAHSPSNHVEHHATLGRNRRRERRARRKVQPRHEQPRLGRDRAVLSIHFPGDDMPCPGPIGTSNMEQFIAVVSAVPRLGMLERFAGKFIQT